MNNDNILLNCLANLSRVIDIIKLVCLAWMDGLMGCYIWYSDRTGPAYKSPYCSNIEISEMLFITNSYH